MGCSRAGALAVICVLAAGAVSMLALLLPYWSKMELHSDANEQLEVTFGLWGSCINLQPTNKTEIDSPVITNGSEVIAIPPESSASDLLTCGGYFDASMIHISCTSFRQLASGQCKRHEFEANGTLCDSKIAVAFLGDDVSTQVITNWLSFLQHACGPTGHASIAFGVLSSVSTGLGIVLLFFGITCASIDSCIGKLGAVCAASTALFQSIVVILWATETRVIRSEEVAFGTSFYLMIISIMLHFGGFLSAKKHQRLEKEAHEEISADLEDEKAHAQGMADGSKQIGLVAV